MMRARVAGLRPSIGAGADGGVGESQNLIKKEVRKMVTIGMNYRVLPGKGEIFENACNGVIKAMEGIEGHSKSFLYRDVNDAQSYLIASEWSSEDAFNAFISSDKFKQVTSWGKESILAGRPSHTVYRQ